MYRAAAKLVGLIVCYAILTGTGASVSASGEDVMALTTPWFHNGWGSTPEPEWRALIDLYLAGALEAAVGLLDRMETPGEYDLTLLLRNRALL